MKRTRKYRGGGGRASRTRKVQRGGFTNPFAKKTTKTGTATPAAAGALTGKGGIAISKGGVYSCSPLIGSTKTLKVDIINSDKKTFNGTDVDGKTKHTKVSASTCSAFSVDPTTQQQFITKFKGKSVTCKDTIGSTTFTAVAVGGTTGKYEIVGFNGTKRVSKPIAKCQVAGAAGAAGSGALEAAFGTGKVVKGTTQGVKITKGLSVRCKTLMKGEKVFKVDKITGTPGPKALVSGMAAGKPVSYTANECEAAATNAVAKNVNGADLIIGNTVSCKPVVGSPKVFKIASIVAGKTPQAATVKGPTGESYQASKCTLQQLDTAAAGFATTISAIKMQISPTDAKTWPSVKAQLEAKVGKIITIFDSKGVEVTQAGQAGGRSNSRKQRGGKLATITTKKTFTVVFGKAGVDPATVQNTVNQDPVLKKNVAGVDVVRTTLDAATMAKVTAASTTSGKKKANISPKTVVPAAAGTGAAAAAPGNAGAAGNAAAASGNAAAAAGNAAAAAGNAAAAAGNAAAAATNTSPAAAVQAANRGSTAATSFVDANAQAVQSGPKPDGIAFPIEPGDYKGLPSKNKYFIYYDPFFQKRAANVIIKTGTDQKVGPQYSYFRITGTDQQILDGIRAIRGMGTGNVFDDLIKDMQQQLVDKRADLSRQQSSLETLTESVGRANVTGQAKEDIKAEIVAMRAEIAATSKRINALEGSITKFQREKEKGVQNATTGAY